MKTLRLVLLFGTVLCIAGCFGQEQKPDPQSPSVPQKDEAVTKAPEDKPLLITPPAVQSELKQVEQPKPVELKKPEPPPKPVEPKKSASPKGSKKTLRAMGDAIWNVTTGKSG